MNKTVTINISGIIFHIEEEAFERLNKYLSTIRGYFSTSDGRDEIMADIESRIAELLQEKISPSKQVVTSTDVEHVIGIMGKPEDFAGESASEAGPAAEEIRTQASGKRRLYRDPDNKVLGGVCGGIAAYFDLDVVWIRVALVLLTFLGFSGVLVYIILWIVVPEAQTTAEKLQMKGETVDINNISKTVREEAEQLKNRAGEMGSKAGQKIGKASNDFAKTLGDVIVRIIGFILLMMGVGFLISFIGTALGLSIAGSEDSSFNEFITSIFPSTGLITLSKFALFLAAGIPILALLYVGIKLLFNIKFSNKWINISLALLWLTGLVLCMYTGLRCYENFDKYAENKENNFITQPAADTLYIGLDMTQKYNNPSYLLDNNNQTSHVKINDQSIFTDGDRKIFMDEVTVKVIPNHLDSLEILVVKSARGANEKDARANSYKIDYRYSMKDSALLLNSYFSVGKDEKWRKQDVTVYIKVPKNKVVYLDPTIKDVIYDIENTTNTYDEEMVGRRWKMTPVGLQCIDCAGLEHKDKIDKALDKTKEELKEIKEEIKKEMKEEKEKLQKELEKVK